MKRYIADNMFNGIAKPLSKAGIECDLAIRVVWGDDDASKKDRYDAKIFRHLLAKKYALVPLGDTDELVLVTADEDLARYCEEFGLPCEYVARDKPPTKAESKELVAKLIAKSQA